MRNNKLVIICLSLCILSILFASALIQKTNDASNDKKDLAEPTARLVSSFPINKTTNYASLASYCANDEKIIITNIEANCTSDTFLVNILNNGSTSTKITDVLVNYQSVIMDDTIVIPPKAYAAILVSYNDELIFLKTYEIKVHSLDAGYAEFFYVIF